MVNRRTARPSPTVRLFTRCLDKIGQHRDDHQKRETDRQALFAAAHHAYLHAVRALHDAGDRLIVDLLRRVTTAALKHTELPAR